jgi:STE24 endopeptidase
VLAAWLILKSYILPRLQARLEIRRPRPILVSFLAAVIFLALDFVLEVPWQAYASWWREVQYGLSSQPIAGWFTDNLIAFAVQLPFLGVFFVALYALMRRAPRSWPIWSGLLAGAFFLFASAVQPVLLEPLLNTYKPAPPGPVRDLVVSLGKATGVPTDKIFVYNGSKQSNRYTANVAGLFGTARVALSDTMFKKGADLAEIRGVVGHEMGHYVHQHVLWFTAFIVVLVMLGGWLLQWLFPVVRNLLGANEIAGVADPAGLPVLMMIFAVLSLLSTPLTNTATRMAEADADHFSMVHANAPDGMAEALIKTAEYRAPSPSPLEEFLFYDHPSVSSRIRKAMDWKASHLGPTPSLPSEPSEG